MKYSIHRALSELKTLDGRINKAIREGHYIGYKKKSSKGDYQTNLMVEEFEKDCKSKLESVQALIKRRNNIKQAIVNSNAVTMVEIGGIEYTVASAIERKDSIDYEKSLLRVLKTQYNEIISNVNRRNERVEEQLEAKIEAMVGGENVSKNIDMVQTFAKSYREDNSWEVIDPLNLKAEIEKLEEYIVRFETEVDYTLSTSNAITMIEIEE